LWCCLILFLSSSVLRAANFTNSASLTIPDSGAAAPYPSTINVTGLTGTVTNMTVTLRNLTHAWSRDVDILLVSPAGQGLVLMSDAGNGSANNVSLTFSDAGVTLPSGTSLASGTFKPANYADASSGGDNYPSPAPGGPYATTLSAFNGGDANGTWRLYVYDDGPNDVGQLAGGWSLTVSTAGTGGGAGPTLSDISDQFTTINNATGPISFTVNDADTPAADLAVSGASSNPSLLPSNGIIFGGGGANRTVTLTPAANQSGTATVTVTVSDGVRNASDSFLLTVGSASTGTASFTNAAAITIPERGIATPYPSTINVTGLAGNLSNITVTLRNLTHAWTRDMDVLLVSPSGQSVILMGDAGNGGANNLTLTFSAAAASALPTTSLNSGTYRPANYSPSDTFPAPAPSGTPGSALNTFNGSSANGTWSLFVYDDGQGDAGRFAGGWSLTLTTTGSTPPPAAPTLSNIPDQSTSQNTPTPVIPVTVGDADTPVQTLTLTGASSNPTLVPTANIVFGGSGANRTVTVTPATGQSGLATLTVTVSDGSSKASDSFVLTVSSGPPPPPPTNSVYQWERFETALVNNTSYADPYRAVMLNVTYTRPDSTVVNFWGFYDGGNVWRIRFMPDQLGTWSYQATFSDGSPGTNGSFQCVAGNLPGLIGKDETNPRWFGFKGGGHVLLRSFHVGDRFFATNWPASSRTAFLDWAVGQGYNMLSIASHYLNRNVAERGAGWATPDLWDGPTRQLKASEYRLMENILNDLAARRIIVFPFAGFFGKSSDFPTIHADQELFLRYTIARVGPYWNLLFAVAGPEPLIPSDTAQYQNAMSFSDLVRLANVIKSMDVLGHLLSVHNPDGDNSFKNEWWEDYTILQGPKTVSRSTLSAGLLAAHGNKPLYAHELLWPGNTQGHPVYTDTDIRKNGFVMIMSATTINFGDMNGNSSSGFSGSMSLTQKIQSRHDTIKKVWDYFATQPVYHMNPRQDLVNNGFCLAAPGREYLVYLQQRGSVSVTVSNGPFQVEWINAQNTQDRRTAPSTSDGANLASPNDGDDWLLHLVNASAVPAEAGQESTAPVNTLALDLERTALLRVEGLPGEKYWVEASEDLLVWETVAQVEIMEDKAVFVDVDAARYPQRFYRVLLRP
jgi:subtilisin-like proprotein convertase family protein